MDSSSDIMAYLITASDDIFNLASHSTVYYHNLQTTYAMANTNATFPSNSSPWISSRTSPIFNQPTSYAGCCNDIDGTLVWTSIHTTSFMGLDYLATFDYPFYTNDIYITRNLRTHATSTTSFPFCICNTEPRPIYFSDSHTYFCGSHGTTIFDGLDICTWSSSRIIRSTYNVTTTNLTSPTTGSSTSINNYDLNTTSINDSSSHRSKSSSQSSSREEG